MFGRYPFGAAYYGRSPATSPDFPTIGLLFVSAETLFPAGVALELVRVAGAAVEVLRAAGPVSETLRPL